MRTVEKREINTRMNIMVQARIITQDRVT